MTHQRPRPWYVVDAACDDYRDTLLDGGRLRMLKVLKLIRGIVVNLGVLTLSLFAVANGGEPTIIATLGLLVFGAYNGLEFSDYMALLQAYREVNEDDQG
jgi:hypothetical protein